MIFDYRCPSCGVEYERDDKTELHLCPECNLKMSKIFASCNAIINCKGTYNGDNRK